MSGWLDDPRQNLSAGHRLFPLAEKAWREQHRWKDDFHRGFWTTLLPQWPVAPGRPPVRQRLGRLVATAQAIYQLRDDEIAALIFRDVDTLRREDLAVVGDQVESDIARSRTDECDLEFPSPPRLPRVVVTGDELADPDLDSKHSVVPDTRPNPLADLDAALYDRFMEMQRTGEVRHHGCLYVRYVDGNPDWVGALAAWRRLQGQDPFVTSADVEGVLWDAVARGKMPLEAVTSGDTLTG